MEIWTQKRQHGNETANLKSSIISHERQQIILTITAANLNLKRWILAYWARWVTILKMRFTFTWFTVHSSFLWMYVWTVIWLQLLWNSKITKGSSGFSLSRNILDTSQNSLRPCATFANTSCKFIGQYLKNWHYHCLKRPLHTYVCMLSKSCLMLV